MEAESKKVEPLNPEPEKRAVERSTIEFPYLDMQNAFEVADGVHKVGGSGCDWDQLAAHFKQAAQGGGFRMRLITAKLFGLVTYDRGRVSLTHLGLRAADHQQMKAAKVEAFLNVPLYKAVYEKFRGGMLPPTAGLEREMVGMGVAKKQADKARQSFHRSAKFAGFYEFGVDRLVAPSVNGAPSSQTPLNPDPAGVDIRAHAGGVGGGSYGGRRHCRWFWRKWWRSVSPFHPRPSPEVACPRFRLVHRDPSEVAYHCGEYLRAHVHPPRRPGLRFD